MRALIAGAGLTDVALDGSFGRYQLSLPGYQLLLRAHAAVGNRAEALRVHERRRCLPSEELDVSPSSQTEAVYLDILRS